MLELTTTQTAQGVLDPVDRLGKPARIEAGSATFTSSDEDVFVVERDPNLELSIKIVPVGPGVAQLFYSADADLDEGVKQIEGFVGIEVKPSEAVGFGIKFSEPVEIPAAAPDETV